MLSPLLWQTNYPGETTPARLPLATQTQKFVSTSQLSTFTKNCFDFSTYQIFGECPVPTEFCSQGYENRTLVLPQGVIHKLR